jgi:Thiamine pyrophosphate enzyme, N-terminal TPP binding domain
MMPTVAETIVEAIADLGVASVWGVVGDALNPITDAIRREDRLRWIGVRHEEVGAFAAGAQAQLGDPLGVCMGTVGPGSVHLLNGLYDAKKSHAPAAGDLWPGPARGTRQRLLPGDRQRRRVPRRVLCSAGRSPVLNSCRDFYSRRSKLPWTPPGWLC